MNFKIKYICQKDHQEDDDGTHYGTMFDKQFGIPVYSAYTLTEDNVDFKEWTRPKWRQTKGIYQAFENKLILLYGNCFNPQCSKLKNQFSVVLSRWCSLV